MNVCKGFKYVCCVLEGEEKFFKKSFNFLFKNVLTLTCSWINFPNTNFME